MSDDENLWDHVKPRGRRVIAKEDTILKTRESDVERKYIEYDGRLLVTEVWISIVRTKHVRIREAGEHETILHKFTNVPKEGV
jgi:hypothetical protein